MTFNAVLSSPDAMLSEGLRLPVCVQMVRQKQQDSASISSSSSSSIKRRKKDAVYFTVRTRDTSSIVQCFTLWPTTYTGPRVVCDHDDVPKSALFVSVTETSTAIAVRYNEKEMLIIEYSLKRSVDSTELIPFRLVFETVEEVRLFMQSMDYLKAGIQHMLQYTRTSGKSSNKTSRSSNSSKSSSLSTATHLPKNDPTRGPASPTTVKFSTEEDASIVSALTGETFIFQAMSIDDSIKEHRREGEDEFSSEEFDFFTIVIPAHVNVFKYTAPILDPSTHATDPMQLTCGGLSIVRLNNHCDLSLALLRLGFREDDEIIEINNRFLVGTTWQAVCNIIGKLAAKNHQRGSYRVKVKRDVDIDDKHENIVSCPSSFTPVGVHCEDRRCAKLSNAMSAKVLDKTTTTSTSKPCPRVVDPAFAIKIAGKIVKDFGCKRDLKHSNKGTKAPQKVSTNAANSGKFTNAKVLQVEEGMIGEHCYDGDGIWYRGVVSTVNRKQGTCTFTYTDSNTYVRGVPFIELRGLHFRDAISIPVVYEGMITECRSEIAVDSSRQSSIAYVRGCVKLIDQSTGAVEVQACGSNLKVSCRVEDLLFLHVPTVLPSQFCLKMNQSSKSPSICDDSDMVENVIDHSDIEIESCRETNAEMDENFVEEDAVANSIDSGNGSVWEDNVNDGNGAEEDEADFLFLKPKSKEADLSRQSTRGASLASSGNEQSKQPLMYGMGRKLSKLDQQWLAKFELLKKYKEKQGDCLVPRSDPYLGRWVRDQRTQYNYFKQEKKSYMTQERIGMLNSIGFVWDASARRSQPKNDVWMSKFEMLKKYKEKHGDFLVPRSDPHLGYWVSNQRKQYNYFKQEKKSFLTQERIGMLNSIGFVWNTRKV